MKKRNFQTHRYEDYSVPEDWKVSMYDFYPRSHVGNDMMRPSLDEYYLDFYPRSHVGND